MSEYREGRISAETGASELGITARRFRQLQASYLKACAGGEEGNWGPGRSGGNRSKEIPGEVEELWRRLLSSTEPASYSFAASEAYRRFDFNVDRATVRRWARNNGLEHEKPPRREPVSVRRWQCQDVGALWQMDASPHRWFGRDGEQCPMIELVDDCSRVIVAARVYRRETLMAYLDILPRAFEQYGLPLALYVDYHSFFFSQIPDHLTYLGWALQFYGVSFRYAPTPQAKGKVERHHLFWQNRLPSFFAAEGFESFEQANGHIDELRLHHNRCEKHRELGMPPQEAWQDSTARGHNVLRRFRRDPWWQYIWSVRTNLKVAIDGTVPVAGHRQRIALPPGQKVTRCEHVDGSYTFLAYPPGTGGNPIVLLRCEAIK